ncbi:23328_t:CDS:2, partial [Racocetra persica]
PPSLQEKNLDSNQFEIRVNQNEFDTKEQGVFYQGLLRIHFYDLFSYQRVRGAIARTSFAEIVFEEAIPIDQEFLPREQHDFRDLVKSLKGRRGKDGQKIPTKITFLANAYSWRVRKVNKKYCLMHFTKNKKETDKELVNFCFNLEEKAKSKLKNCVLRKKPALISNTVKIMNSILSIDPGGKTGIYYKNGEQEQLLEINKP